MGKEGTAMVVEDFLFSMAMFLLFLLLIYRAHGAHGHGGPHPV
jgi:hypothetical protein